MASRAVFAGIIIEGKIITADARIVGRGGMEVNRRELGALQQVFRDDPTRKIGYDQVAVPIFGIIAERVSPRAEAKVTSVTVLLDKNATGGGNRDSLVWPGKGGEPLVLGVPLKRGGKMN